ncbi:MAG: oxygenase MpaB family protein [Acidimicrobiales bacterium]
MAAPSLDTWLDQLRYVGDCLPSADLELLSGTEPPEPASESWAALSASINAEMVWQTQQFFATFLTQIGAALLHGVLPSSFAAARGAQVLFLSETFQQSPAKRLADSTTFFLDIFDPDYDEYSRAKARGLTTLHPGGSGARAALRVRLGHFRGRQHIMTDPKSKGQWSRRYRYFRESDPSGPPLGMPLNQEDLLGMLLEFTVGLFDAIDLLGVPYSNDDKLAWFHTWDIVGRYMGIGTVDGLGQVGPPAGGAVDDGAEPDEIAPDLQLRFVSDRRWARSGEGRRLGYLPDLCPRFHPLDAQTSGELLAVIRQRHRQPSFEGKMLTNAVLQELQRPLSWDLKAFPRSLIRYLVGDEAAAMIGLSPGGWVEHSVSGLRNAPGARRLVTSRYLGAPIRAGVVEVSSRSSRTIIDNFNQNRRSEIRQQKAQDRFTS